VNLIEFVNLKLAVLTVLAQVFIISAVFYLIFFRKKYFFVTEFLSKYGLFLSFVTALVATLGSLFYSEFAMYTPCTLCWYQRIFMYPQVIILGMALWKKDRGIINYTILLSVVGVLIAGYHYLMQVGAISSLPCPVIGYSISCVQLFVMQFSYITLPLMSLTAFLQIVILLYFVKIRTKN